MHLWSRTASVTPNFKKDTIMDEIKQRLTEASEACIKTYEAWRGKTTDHSARESLQEAVHELRKVAARLEIELAVSDRKQHGNEPIPIPSHRASRRPAQGADTDMGEDDNRANRLPPQGGQGGGQRRPVHIRRPQSDNPGNEAAAPAAAPAAAAAPAPAAEGAEGEDGQRKPRPLSLRRSTEGE